MLTTISTLVMVALLPKLGGCSPIHGATFSRVRTRTQTICAKISSDFLWFDAVAGEMKNLMFLMACAEATNCQGIQTTRNGSGYYWLPYFPKGLTLNDKDCRMFFKDKVCLVNLSSWGFIDVGASRLDSFIQVLGGQKFSNTGYGVNTAELDPVTCTISKMYNFNTQMSPNRTLALRDYLKDLKNGTIVLGVTYDAPSEYLGPIVDYLASINLNVSGIQYRGKFTFAWQKGFPEKTVFHLRNGDVPLNNLVAILGGGDYRTSMIEFTT